MPTAYYPSQVQQFVEEAILTKQIPYVSGPPGIGKSDIVMQVAKDHGLKMIDIRLSQMLPEDLTGLPQLNKKTGKATYMPFDTFPMEADTVPDGYNGWMIFLDELSSASEEVMAAIYSLLLGHRIGGKPLHKRAIVVAAGNRSSDSAIARPLPDTLVTRMLCIEMKPNAKDWIEWAKSDKCDNMNGAVVNFIEKYPDSLYDTSDPSQRDELETYPTPRGWAKVFNVMHFNQKIEDKEKVKNSKNIDQSIPLTYSGLGGNIKRLITSAVGTTACTSFVEYYNDALRLPNPWEIAQSPATSRIPVNTVAQAQLVGNLADYYASNHESVGEAILQYVNRLHPESKRTFLYKAEELLGNKKSVVEVKRKMKKRLMLEDPAPKGNPTDPDPMPF